MAKHKEKSGFWFAALVVFLFSAWAYAQAGTWVSKAPMPSARCCLAAVAVSGEVYAVGGGNPDLSPTFALSRLEAYNPKADIWSTRAPMPTPRTGFSAAALNGTLYVVGGGNSVSPYLGTLEAYDPKADAWSTKAPMPLPRKALAFASADGKLYAMGGEAATGLVATVEAFDPATNTWSERASMPGARIGFGAVTMGRTIYVVGGEDTSTPPDGRPRVVYAYDPSTNTWATRASIPTGRDGLAVAVAGGRLYAMGGQNQFGYNGIVESYDPATDSWSGEPPMPTPRMFLAAATVEDTVYAVGGIDADPVTKGTVFLATNEAFSPFLMVSIDIKPGDPTNTINLKSNGVVPVAILGSATFDPMTVDPSTVTFAGAPVATRGRNALMTGQSDVNGDGYPDLVLYFRTQDLTALEPAQNTDTSAGHRPALQQVEAVLYGTTYSGQRIRGSDTVRIVPPAKGSSAGAAGPFVPQGRLRPALQPGGQGGNDSGRGAGVAGSDSTGSSANGFAPKTLPPGNRGRN
jgi:N-acetylneuraminic acid mutarotase